MDLLDTMNHYAREASWAVWARDSAGELTGDAAFPLDQARTQLHGRAMIVSLNPGSDKADEIEHTKPDWSNFHSLATKHNDMFLAKALIGTKLWGAYMTDLHSDIAESNSALVRIGAPGVEIAVHSLITQAHLLGAVESIICVGKQSHASVRKHARLIEEELGLQADSIVGIPHYSRSNAGVHKHRPELYRALVHQAIDRP